MVLQFVVISGGTYRTTVVSGRTKMVTETHESCASTKTSTVSSYEAPVSINPKRLDDPISPMMPF